MSLRTQNGVVPCSTMYALVPAQALPAVDLSKSFRGRLLPARLHTFIRRRYYKYHRPILLCFIMSYCFTLLAVLVQAPVGRALAVLAFVLWVPMGLGSVTTLRYDIVRLVSRTFDFWFFSTITSVIAVTMSMYLSDLRWVRMFIDWFSFHHVIFIDAHVMGLSNVTYLLIFGMLSLATVWIWIVLGQVDGGSTFTIIKYKNDYGGFHLSGMDVIGNGLISLGLLLTKIIFRRRKTLRIRRKRSSSLVQCVIYRCRLKLEPVHGSEVSLAWDSKVDSKDMSLQEADIIQHLVFVKFPHIFDATNTLIPGMMGTFTFLSRWFLVAFYSVGAMGFLLCQAAFFQRFDVLISWISLFCTIFFTAFFASFYQRQLLKLLFYSFDFAFYSFQVTSAVICVCSLYSWDLPQCLMVTSWWIWAHWVFMLDALTPVMRIMLKFRVHFAAPILCLLLVDYAVVIYHIFFTGGPQLRDSSIFEGKVWSQHLSIRVIPFYISRSLTLILWCSRLVFGLASASKDHVTILRGSVCYDNFFGKGRSTSSQLTQVVKVKAHARLTQISPDVSFYRT